MAPEKRFPERRFNAVTLLGCFAVSFGLWIITGALAYSHRNTSLKEYDFAQFITIFLTTVVNLVLVAVTIEEYGLHPNPPISRAAILITVVMFFSTTMAYCIVVPAEGFRNLFQDLFLVIGSIYAAVVFEVSTGLSTGYLRSLKADEGPSTTEETGSRAHAQ